MEAFGHIEGLVGDLLADAVDAAAVAEADVEIAVRPEGEPAAIVFPAWPVHRQHDPLGAGVDAVRVGRIGDELRHPPRVVPARRRSRLQGGGVGHEEPAVDGEAGVQGKAQQPPLVEALDQPDHALAQVEPRPIAQPAVRLQHADRARLLGDQQAPATVVGIGDVDRRRQAARQQFERNPGRLLSARGACLKPDGERPDDECRRGRPRQDRAAAHA